MKTAAPVAAATAPKATEVRIESAGHFDYDLNSKVTTASDKVKMSSGDVVVEADQLVYDGNSEVVKATGHIRLTNGEMTITADKLVYNNATGQAEASGAVTLHTPEGDYQTETITYNSRTASGKMDQFSGRIPGGDRDYRVTGQAAVTTPTSTAVTGATLTRCPLPNPEYQLSAKLIQVDDQKVHLEKVVVRVKGIPVFYFPSLTLNRNEKRPPRFGFDYDHDDGMKLNYEYTTPRTEHLEWRFHGQLTTRGDSTIDAGFRNLWDNFTHQMDFEYNTNGYLTLADQVDYETPTFSFVTDGSRDFSDEATQKWGLAVTRKYWDTPAGRLQLGFMARNITTSTGGEKINGTYGGYRFDYSPVPNLTVGLLHLADLSSASREQWSYLEEQYLVKDYKYKLGDNFIYNFSFPLNDQYSLGTDGVYNFNHFGPDKNDWVRQVYSITHETCCLSTSLGWNVADHSLELRWRLKF